MQSNKWMFRIVVSALALWLTACAGVGIVETNDPKVKLAQADYLFKEQGRVMQARRQLDEAIVLFEQRGDKLGLAYSYLLYGLLARFDNPDPTNRVIYMSVRPRDALGYTHTPAQIDASDDYYRKARDYANEAQDFDLLASALYALGVNMKLRGEPLKACPFYDQSLTASREARRRQPDRKVSLPSGFSSMEEWLVQVKKDAGCPAS